MDHMRILRRAFAITLDYRVLWVFGILVALTTAHANGGSNGGGGGGGNGGGGLPGVSVPGQAWSLILSIGLALICLVLILALIGTVARYVSETALIRLVNQHEDTGVKETVGQGFRLGWSRGAWRIFLIDLLFGVAFFLVVALLLAVAFSPLLLWLFKNEGVGIFATLITVGLVFFTIILLIVAAAALSILKQFWWRAAVIEDRGVFDAIARGYWLVRKRLGDVILMALILFGLGLAYVIVLIPLVILLMLVGLVLGGLPGLLVAFLVGQFFSNAAPWVFGLIVGLPIFFLVLFVPLTFLGGLVSTYTSSVWTLTYREAAALAAVAGVPAGEPPEAGPEEPEGEPELSAAPVGRVKIY